MKNNLFLLISLLVSLSVKAQVPQEITLQMVDNPNFEKDFFSAIDMKIFHDSQITQDILLQMAKQQANPLTAADGSRDRLTQGIFNERDSEILETTMDSKRISYDVTPELLEKAYEEPFEAFKDLVRSAHIPRLTPEELEKLNQVDDKAISKHIQMVTESGPDIGARPVSVIYNK